MSLFREIFHIIGEKFSKSSAADLLYVGKGQLTADKRIHQIPNILIHCTVVNVRGLMNIYLEFAVPNFTKLSYRTISDCDTSNGVFNFYFHHVDFSFAILID